MKTPPAPARWLPQTRKFYRHVNTEWDIVGEDTDLLLATCERLDQFYQCQGILDAEGLTVGGENGGGILRQHPAAGVQRVAWSGFLAGLKHLDLVDAATKNNVGRPAGIV